MLALIPNSIIYNFHWKQESEIWIKITPHNSLQWIAIVAEKQLDQSCVGQIPFEGLAKSCGKQAICF